MHTWLHDQQWHLGTPTELTEGRNIPVVVYLSFLRVLGSQCADEVTMGTMAVHVLCSHSVCEDRLAA